MNELQAAQSDYKTAKRKGRLTCERYPRYACLSKIEYNSDTKTLYLTFGRSGSMYSYFNVPGEIYTELVYAVSRGRYFSKYIKEGSYRYLCLTPPSKPLKGRLVKCLLAFFGKSLE